MLRSTVPNQLIVVAHHALASNDNRGPQGRADFFVRERLVPFGAQQTEAMARYVALLFRQFVDHDMPGAIKTSPKIISAPRPNCLETGVRMRRAWSSGQQTCLRGLASANLVVKQECAGIDLGFAAGLTERQIADRYRDYAERMAAWRRGMLHEPPQAPGGETVGRFGKRMFDMVQGVIDDGAHSVLVVQRSAYLAIKSTLDRDVRGYDGRAHPNPYAYREVPPGAVAAYYIHQHGPPERLADGYVPEVHDLKPAIWQGIGNVVLHSPYMH